MSKEAEKSAEKVRWNLTELFQSIKDPKIEIILKESLKKAKEFESTYKGKLKTLSTEELKQAYLTIEALISPLYKLSQFVSLSLTIDTTNDELKALESKTDDIFSELQNHIVFFELEIAKIDLKTFEKHYNNPSFKDYAYSLKRSIETAKHNLSEEEEKIITLKDLTGSSAFKKLYEELTSSFEYEFEKEKGKKEILNGSQLRSLRTHPDKTIRRRAMKTFYKKYEENKIVLTHIFNNILKDYATEKKLRHYQSAISRRNTANDLPDSVIEILHKVTKDSYPLVQRYYKLKAQILKLEDLSLADIYAPMPENTQTFTFEEAKELVLKGFKAFDDEFYNFAKKIFDEKRIDAAILPKKRGGAFCSSSTPDIAPYVMLNFLGQARDVATLAHELGHAIHDLYASKQVLTNYHPILPLAETASVFSEMIITDLLLKEETNLENRRALLTEKLEDMFATSHRQNMFSLFEIETHKRTESELLSTTDLNQLYQTHLKDMFGDSVIQPEEYQWEWSTIPHIFEWPFYVYAYNFGNLLVIALYQQYKEEGTPFKAKLKTILGNGSAKSPLEILEEAGIDIKNPEFWKKSLTYIEHMINELENIQTQLS